MKSVALTGCLSGPCACVAVACPGLCPREWAIGLLCPGAVPPTTGFSGLRRCRLDGQVATTVGGPQTRVNSRDQADSQGQAVAGGA